jgi:holo-[acyl-carrier protein] synthase
MIAGTGTDIVSVDRVSKLLDSGGERFAGRWFTPGEIAYCRGQARPAEHFAARIAAKEAVLKALRSPWDGPMRWLSIEIAKDGQGAPIVRLSGTLREEAERAGISAIHVSLSHCGEYATATAIAEAAPLPPA